MKNEEFKDMELVDGNLKVVWEYIGEGASGDYCDDDPDDEPLLRFSCYEKLDTWEQIDDASYCTRMKLDTPRSILSRALKVIMKELKDARDGGSSGKKVMERMSWICADDFKDNATVA